MLGDPPHMPSHVQQLLERAKEDAELQRIMPDTALELHPDLSYADMLEAIMQAYAPRQALGERSYILSPDSTGRVTRAYQPRFDTISYAELNNRIKSLAGCWLTHPQHRLAIGEFVCILGHTGIDFLVVDLACAYAQTVSVPLQTSMVGGDIDGIVAETGAAAIAATMADLVQATQLAGRHGSVRSVIAFDYEPGDDGDRAIWEAAQAELRRNGSSASLVALDELTGSFDPKQWAPPPPHPDGLQRMALLLHSSGSTGRPKGVIMTDHIVKAAWRPSPAPFISVAYAPMNHFAGRTQISGALAVGGTAFFTATPDLAHLFEDMRLVRPTHVMMLPRILEMVHRHYLNEVVRRGGDGEGGENIRAEVMADMRATHFGDRVAQISHGSAPATEEIKRFFAECFQVEINEGYGQTEAGGGIARDGRLSPFISAYKLRDVPALGYHVTDKPYPRGELCIKSSLATPGYFNQPEATARLFDEDGFLCTGDIMEERGPREVRYIDRANDVLKLSQGEFVATGALTMTFESGSPLIEQIYIHGNSVRSYLLAVVVPNLAVASQRLGEDFGEPALRALIGAELKEVARRHDLRAFEVPRDFIVEYEPFSFENGLLTSILKRRRAALKARYGDALEALYEQLEKRQQEEFAALRQSGELTILQHIGKALEIILGVEEIDPSLPYSFSQFGGDSLAAVSFSSLLEEMFGVDIPVSAILSPAGSPTVWAEMIKAANDEPTGPTMVSVHGENPEILSADDLDLDAFFDTAMLEAVQEPPEGAPSSILLTGATGFLGRFLCLEWLERLAERGGKLICLVRATDEATARDRLLAQFSGPDPILEAHVRALADAHLQILIGDIAAPRLGLDTAAFAKLATEVEHIVHCGALVNHMLSYADLFGPNVASTAELIRLALTSRKKRFDFISTVGVFGFLEAGQPVTEATPLARTAAVTDNYAWGYSASKWASEHLLRAANARFGLPVNIFRCDMILSHRKYRGQINLRDVFSRLLCSVVTTRLAPASFYERNADGSRRHAHYDGLPSDFIAAAITGIGEGSSHDEVRIFNVLNHHVADGISLDRLMEWVGEAGYPLELVADHAQWRERFEQKLRALPEAQRQHTSLPVMLHLQEPMPIPPVHPDSAAFVDAVRRLPSGEVPRLDRVFLFKCLSDLQAHGLIAPPMAPANAPSRDIEVAQ